VLGPGHPCGDGARTTSAFDAVLDPEVPPPIVAKAEELGCEADKTAASWVFDANTPEDAYQRVPVG
jgi:hypothetical protein